MDELFAFKIIILVFSVILHEVMHGLSALHFGDHTAERAGRLTLNPIPHIDPIGTLLVPLMLGIYSGGTMIFGWAKPVPVNPLHFNNLRLGELVTSAAGIGANIFLALIGVIIFHVLPFFYVSPILQRIVLYIIEINFLLFLFNLIPIPPLDGSKILMSQLPYNAARTFQQLEPYGFFIIIALSFIPIGNITVLSLLLTIGMNFLLNLFQIFL